MRKLVILIAIVVLCSFVMPYAYAWEVPNYIRANGGIRMWFTNIEGDLIQADRTKIGIGENMGLKKEKLAWEFFASTRLDNVHVFWLRAEPSTVYDQSSNDSFLQVKDWRLGYDFDFFMTPQVLFGANAELVFAGYDTKVSSVIVGNSTYNYRTEANKVFPTIGIHGTYYPIVQGIALRPNITGRVNWWNYNNFETWDWETLAGVDIPINQYWTWNVSGGYRYAHIKFNRDIDTLDINRNGFFLETSLLF
ncbi:MAG: hypothetical protein ACP5U1_11665 [Desulfomonilaceae bacterium]